MRNNALCLIIITCALAGVLMPSGASRAADYDVAFGVETKRSQDFGSVTCPFNEICSARMESLGLRVTVHRFRDEPRRASVRIYGRDISCCYFVGAADSISVDPQKPLSRVPFFSGEPARGYLLPQNEYAGTLYLKFRAH
jgi:hypothetical protein